MPRPRIHKGWREHVFSLLANERLSPATIAKRVKADARLLRRDNRTVPNPPSERTVRRLREEWLTLLTEAERRQYRYFRWPESMEDAALPWEASCAALELLRQLHGLHRPPIRLVKWFWRVTQTVPRAPLGHRFRAAAYFAGQETLGEANPDDTRRAEWWLAFQPWRSPEDAEAYQRSQELVGADIILPFVGYSGPSLRAGIDYGDDVLEEVFDCMMPGTGRVILKFLKERGLFGDSQGVPKEEEASND